MVEYFDYQCTSCRMMRENLLELLEKHPANIYVILLSGPLDHVLLSGKADFIRVMEQEFGLQSNL
jgi:hypothetical protein